jgi:hypothetical protein
MDRRDFLWAVSTASAGGVAAMTVAPALTTTGKAGKGGPAVASPQYEVTAQRVQAQSVRGSLPFTLSKFADDYIKVMGQKRIAGRPLAVLSPLKDVVFNGFAQDALGAHANDRIDVAALHRADNGALMRHELWGHRPQSLGGTSKSVIFTAHDDAFVGLDVMHTSSAGITTQATFAFSAGGGMLLNPGIYVMAGPRASTGLPPELDRFGYTGFPRAPIAESGLGSRDFAYISFVVHGEWI